MFALIVLLLLPCLPTSASGNERHVLIVAGASGGQEYAEQYAA
jgi:hypothetical protein